MMETNVKWQAFVKDLKARGIFVRWGWTANSFGGARKVANIGQVNFIGNGFQPAILWAVVVDYTYNPHASRKTNNDQSGFALCVDSGGLTIAAEVDKIAGPNAPTREALASLRSDVI